MNACTCTCYTNIETNHLQTVQRMDKQTKTKPKNPRTVAGKPGSIRTCLDAVFPAIPYCIDLLGGPYLEGNEAKVKVFRPQNK
jgi:hypothetical protein